MSTNLDLGHLGIRINLDEGEPVSARFTLPDGSVVTRPFNGNGELDMRLGMGLGLGYTAAPGGGVGATAPVNTGLPVISGTAQSGQTLSTTNGTWDDGGAEISGYAYQWKADGVAIEGATASTFELTDTQIGAVITVTVTATNSEGSADATSAGTDEVGAAAGLILDGTSPNGAWSFSRDLLTAFAGSTRFDQASGVVSTLYDQSGNGRNLAQATEANRPAVTTAGPNGIVCADFTPVDYLVGASLSNFIANNSGYMIVSFLPDTISTNNANSWTNHGILTDGSVALMGLYLRNTDADVGDPDTIQAYNWDGSADVASSAAIIAGTAYVAEWKHESGNISVRINGGTWVDVASGNTSGLTGLLTMGTGNTTAGGSLDGKGFEAAIWSSIPASGVRDAIVADFMAHIGI